MTDHTDQHEPRGAARRGPRWLPVIILVVGACLVTGVTTAIAVQPQRFSDVPPTHPFYEEIEQLGDGCVSGGYPDGTFRPGSALTRQAEAAFIARSAGIAQHQKDTGWSGGSNEVTLTFTTPSIPGCNQYVLVNAHASGKDYQSPTGPVHVRIDMYDDGDTLVGGGIGSVSEYSAASATAVFKLPPGTSTLRVRSVDITAFDPTAGGLTVTAVRVPFVDGDLSDIESL